MSELEQYIKSYFGIQENDLDKLAILFQKKTYKKGDYLLKTGKLCDRLSFVQSGLVRIYSEFNDKEITQWISTKGYFVVDLSSFIFDTPARWNLQALTDVELYSISKNDYLQINDVIPQWNDLEKLFLSKCFTMMEDRIFSHLSLTSEERYTSFFKNNKELFNQVPLQYIASMLGMTPETFSRIRKKHLL